MKIDPALPALRILGRPLSAGGFLNAQTAGAVSAFSRDFASLLVFCGSFRRFLRKYGDIFLFLCYNTAVHYFLQEVAY